MIIQALFLALLIELVTLAGRAFFGPMKERYKKIRFKYKIRIHHGYVGLAMLVLHYANALDIPSQELLFIVGFALFFSDAFHHFVALPILVGRTEFP